MKSNATINIWDLPTRIFHWCLVALVINSFVTAEIGGNAMQYHVYSGYAILTLLLFRIVWGVIGSRTARFADFVRGPKTVLRYARSLMHADPPAHAGHNPMGGWSILAMLLALLVQVATGLFATDDIATQGPLYPLVSDETSHWLTNIHLFNQGVIIALVSLHLAAILFYLLVKGDNLVRPMITGNKPRRDSDLPDNIVRPSWLALIGVAVCAAAVYYIVRLG